MRWAIHLLDALSFLTRLPLPRRETTLEGIGQTAWAFPVVGMLIGLLLTGAAWLLGLIFPSLLSAALVLACWVAVTGALHLDGWVDCCDALFAAQPPEVRMEILRDVHVGAFGVVGGAMLLLVKFATLAALLPGEKWPVLFLAPALGRWAMVYAIVRYPYARPQGLGTAFKERTGLRGWLIATAITLVAVAVGRSWAGLLAFAVAGGLTVFFSRWVLGRLPGLTGDVYGALCELVETLVLLVWAGAGG